ncbi:MAG: glycosyltransferase family 1 protein [Candidatus Marinimicrobia bacterium]|nr:glycosyltransferase family 1 protein [Candidatus Neomarinimicrobiota bacterium]
MKMGKIQNRILFIVSEDWYFVSHRLELAIKSIEKGYNVALLSRYHKDKTMIENLGIQTIDWTLDRSSKNIFKETIAIKNVVTAINAFKPHLVHSVAFKPVLYSAIGCYIKKIDNRIFALAGLGYVFSSSSIKAKIIQFVLKKVMKKMLMGNKTRLILQNPNDVTVLESSNLIAKNKIRLIRGAGVNVDKFFYKELPIKTFNVVLSSRMLYSKGIEDFKECAKIIGGLSKHIKFQIVGKPDEHNPDSIPLNVLNKWSKAENFEYKGFRNDMVKILHESSLVCLPTSYGEGIPKALLEGASCGRPIIAYDVPGCREIVEHGHNGFLIERKNINSLADAIYTLYQNYRLCVKMGQNGRRIIEKNFTTEIIVSKTQKVWEELLIR